MSPAAVTKVIESQATLGNFGASKRMAPSSAWSYSMSNWSTRPERSVRGRGLQAQVIEVVVGVVEAQHGEILGRLENAGDGQAGLSGFVAGGRRCTPGEALDGQGVTGIEKEERFRHKCGERNATQPGRCRRSCRTWLPLHSYEGVALSRKSRDVHDYCSVAVGKRVRHLYVELVKTGGTEAGPQHLRL